MLKIENVEVLGWEHAIRGMRNPKTSWEMSDSRYYNDPIFDEENPLFIHDNPIFSVGPNDQKLMMTLRNAGTDHRKFMRMIAVYLDITAPLYWWKEFDTYKIGSVANSCSTMHKIHAKEFVWGDFSVEHLDDERNVLENCNEYQLGDHYWPEYTAQDILNLTIYALNYYRDLYLQTKDKQYWWQMIQLLPSSYNQKRTVMLNYEVLANIYKSRKDHKLDCWHTLCDWMETLPMPELITGERKQPNWTPSDQGLVLNYILQNDPRRDVENVAVRIAHSSPYVVDYIAVRYDDSNAKKVWYSFDMTKVTAIEALDAVKKAIAKMTENVSANGLSETSNAIGLELGA